MAGFPWNWIDPESGVSTPLMILMSVDLPAPLSPTSPVISPVGRSMAASCKATTAPKLLLTRSTRSRASGIFAKSSNYRLAESIARSEAPLPPSRAVPGKTINPPMSDREETCESVSLQSASDIGGPQSATTAEFRFESACKTGSVFLPATLTTAASVDATHVGGCNRML